jgi:hypothetical protein
MPRDSVINIRQFLAALVLGVGAGTLAVGVGNYWQVGLIAPWMYKIIHVIAGFSLAMCFRALGLSWVATLLWVAVVSILYEGFEAIIATPGLADWFWRLAPWYAMPSVSLLESGLDFARNFGGTCIYFLGEKRGWW